MTEKFGFFMVLALILVLGAGTAWAWGAASSGAGLSNDMDGVSLRSESRRRAGGTHVYVGGGLRGGK